MEALCNLLQDDLEPLDYEDEQESALLLEAQRALLLDQSSFVRTEDDGHEDLSPLLRYNGSFGSLGDMQNKDAAMNRIPKRALSAYNMFFQQHRQEILNLQSQPEPPTVLQKKVAFKALARQISGRWKKAPVEEKTYFDRLSLAAKKNENGGGFGLQHNPNRPVQSQPLQPERKERKFMTPRPLPPPPKIMMFPKPNPIKTMAKEKPVDTKAANKNARKDTSSFEESNKVGNNNNANSATTAVAVLPPPSLAVPEREMSPAMKRIVVSEPEHYLDRDRLQHLSRALGKDGVAMFIRAFR